MSRLSHTAVVFSDPGEVADRLVPELEADLEGGAAVIVTADPAVAAAVRDRLGDRDDVRYVDAYDRDARPVDAVEVLWRATRDWIADGGRSLTAVGQLGFPGGSSDDEWHWYEAAVNEVLADEPIKGVCLYDERTVGEQTVHEACLTHPRVSADDPELVGAYRGPTGHRPPVPAVPHRSPEIAFQGLDDKADVAHVRAAVRAAMVSWPEELVDQVLLVVSELVTNCIRHGGGCCTSLSMWVDDAEVSMQVVDAGPGIGDPYAPLRPPDLGVRGVGLWLCSRESTRFTVSPAAHGGTVATATLRRMA